ncbi:MAG: hypothetical protein ABSF83_05855 [Nitrososphaerales archaeon]|jgi:hypothetical protein
MVLASVLVLALVSAGLGVYVFEQASCYWACGGIPSPVIQSAQAGTSRAESNCPFGSATAVSWNVVCSVYINGGDSGTVTLTVANHGPGDSGSDVDFLVYSSEPQYINFTAIPACAHTTAPPLNDEAPCTLSGSAPQTFQFAFAVSQGYGASSLRELASVTVVMYQTCCFP